jgi:hypothetical protein
VTIHSFAFSASRHLKFSYKSILPCTAFPSTFVNMLDLSPPLPVFLLLRVRGLSRLNTRAIRLRECAGFNKHGAAPFPLLKWGSRGEWQDLFRHPYLSLSLSIHSTAWQQVSIRDVQVPWYVPSAIIRRDLQVPSVKVEIHRLSAQYYSGFCTHPNLLATQLSRP